MTTPAAISTNSIEDQCTTLASLQPKTNADDWFVKVFVSEKTPLSQQNPSIAGTEQGGVGKSSLVNSIIGERVVPVSAFQPESPRPMMVICTRAGFTLEVIDTPSLVEEGYVNDRAIDIIKNFLLNQTIDVLLYVDRLDTYRVDVLDRQIVKAITDSFGKEIWQRGLVVLTHAQLSPPDGLPYDEFLSRRSEALLKVVRLGAKLRKQDIQNSNVPIVLVENSGRCKKNGSDEKILPDGTPWIPNLFKIITDAVLGGGKSMLVDMQLIGSKPKCQGKGVHTTHFSSPIFLSRWLHKEVDCG